MSEPWLIMVSSQPDPESGRWRVTLNTPGDHVLQSICAVSKERAVEQARMIAKCLGLVEKSPSEHRSAAIFFEVPT